MEPSFFGSLWHKLVWLVRVFISSLERFYVGNGFSRAASLAYTTLFSLVPVMALSFGLLASFSLSDYSASEVVDFLFQQYVPGQVGVESVRESVKEMSTKALAQFGDAALTVNVFGLVFLVLTAILLLNSIEYALNEVWQVFEVRSLGSRLSIFCAIIVLGPIFAISIYYSARFTPGTYLGSIDETGIVAKLYTQLLPLIIDTISFFLLYFLVPKAPVKVRSALFGALLSALLFSAAKTSFAVYIVKFSTYGAIYGALAAIPIFLFWLYLTWVIVLLGCEASYQWQNLPSVGWIWKGSVLDVGDGRVLLGVQALVLITKAFHLGEKLPNDWELAGELECSSAVLKPILNSLEKARIIARSDNRDMSITLQRSPENIRLSEIVAAVKQGRGSVFCAAEMGALFQSLDGGRNADTVSLSEIVSTRGKGDIAS